jgi:cytochrome P450 family 93 subfamily A
VVGTSRLADESDIPRLPYLEAITKETLRLHPTGPLVVRRSLELCAVGGYDVPAGATAFVNVWAIGRDPASWAPDPLAGAVPGGGRGRGGGRARAALPAAAVRVRAADVPRRVAGDAGGAGRAGRHGAVLRVAACRRRPVDMEEGPGLTLPRKHPLVCTVAQRIHPLPVLAADMAAPGEAAFPVRIVLI